MMLGVTGVSPVRRGSGRPLAGWSVGKAFPFFLIIFFLTEHVTSIINLCGGIFYNGFAEGFYEFGDALELGFLLGVLGGELLD